MSKARCLNCGDVIESKDRHDWVCCSCFDSTKHTRGFYLDGGNDYIRCGGNLDDIEWIDASVNPLEEGKCPCGCGMLTTKDK